MKKKKKAKQKKPSKNEQCLGNLLENLSNCPWQRSFFWPSESISDKVMTILVLFHPKMKKPTMSPQSPFWLKFHFLVYGYVSLVYTRLSNKTLAKFGSWFTTQFTHDPAMMPIAQCMFIDDCYWLKSDGYWFEFL